MSIQPTDQRFVLDLLETGKIDTGEADWLLEKIGSSPRRLFATPFQPNRKNKVVLEIDADEENLQAVIEKLNEAICTHQEPNQKQPFLQRLGRRTKAKSTSG